MSRGAVVVGTSVAGVRTAEALRAGGYAGEVRLVGEDTEEPYDKPPLSKALLTGTKQDSDAHLLTREQAAAAGIELLLGRRSTSLDTQGHSVELEDGTSLHYDHLVIATGARARPSPWEAPGVHVLRSMQDMRALREDLRRGGHLVVVGGGFIGSEVASSARTLGLEVTIVDPVAVPISRIVSEEIGEHFLDLHRRNGVVTRLGTGVEAVLPADQGLRVTLDDGSELDADTVVVGIGSIPNDGWLASSGLHVEDGVVCDEYGRASGAEDIYAVGDVSRWHDPALGLPVRVEHWTNAVEQARVVAHNIVHPDDLLAHQPVHYVWSDQHDWKIQVAGRTAGARQAAFVGDPAADGRFVVLYTQDDAVLAGAVTVNWPQAGVICRRALVAGDAVSVVHDKLEAALAKRRLSGATA